MKRFEVITVPRAERDIEEAFRWIAEHAPLNAVGWVHGVRRAIQSLDFMPTRCVVSPESPVAGSEVRQLVFGNYRILFTVQGDTVYILHVRHAAREPMLPHEVDS
jgi:plasmid stabilization system protein ParE